jgi:phage shock protein PspC (stress-responsive transcriptional regulator)
MVGMTEFSDTPPAAQPAGSADDPAGRQAASGDDATGALPPQPPVTDAPPPPPPPPLGAFAARYGLIRPRTGRYLAGVSGAVARATNTDPVLWRVLFVVLAFFGGFGILAYLVLWLGTPAEGDTASPVEAVFGRGRSSTSATLTVIVGVITVLILMSSMGGDGWPGAWALVALVVIGLIVFYSLPRRDHPSMRHYAPPPVHPQAPGTGGEAYMPPGYQPAFAPHGPYAPPPPPPPPAAVRPPKPPKEHSRLGGLILSTALVVLGIMGLLDVAGIFDIPVAAYFAAALAVIGAGLVLGAVLGRARGMIFFGLALVLALSISGFNDDFNWKHGANGGGDVTWTPQSFSELQDTYTHQAGAAELDLRGLDFAGQDKTVHLRIQAGDLRVVVPPNVDVTADASVRLGSATVFDRNANGVRINDFTVTDLGRDGEGGGKLHLDIQVSLGNAEVYR